MTGVVWRAGWDQDGERYGWVDRVYLYDKVVEDHCDAEVGMGEARYRQGGDWG